MVLLIPTTLMGGTLPALTRAFTGDDRSLLKPRSALYGLTPRRHDGHGARRLFPDRVRRRQVFSLWATAAINLAIGIVAIKLGQERSPAVNEQIATSPSDQLRRLALVLLGVTAFAALLDEIAWTRVLVMIVGGSTYAFTLILLVFLLGIGLGR